MSMKFYFVALVSCLGSFASANFNALSLDFVNLLCLGAHDELMGRYFDESSVLEIKGETFKGLDEIGQRMMKCSREVMNKTCSEISPQWIDEVNGNVGMYIVGSGTFVRSGKSFEAKSTMSFEWNMMTGKIMKLDIIVENSQMIFEAYSTRAEMLGVKLYLAMKAWEVGAVGAEYVSTFISEDVQVHMPNLFLTADESMPSGYTVQGKTDFFTLAASLMPQFRMDYEKSDLESRDTIFADDYSVVMRYKFKVLSFKNWAKKFENFTVFALCRFNEQGLLDYHKITLARPIPVWSLLPKEPQTNMCEMCEAENVLPQDIIPTDDSI